MLTPSIFRDNLFDDFFGFPKLKELDDMDKKFYGRHMGRIMKTDIKELENTYEIGIEIPGFTKEELSVELKDGYLLVTAEKKVEEDNKNDQGKIIRQERYFGTMSRSFYIGEDIKQEDVKAHYEHGILTLTVPKKAEEKIPEKTMIAIEG